METDDLSGPIIGCPIEVHRQLGRGLWSPSRSPRLPWNLNSPGFIWSVKCQSGVNICRMAHRSPAGEVRCCRIEEWRRNRSSFWGTGAHVSATYKA